METIVDMIIDNKPVITSVCLAKGNYLPFYEFTTESHYCNRFVVLPYGGRFNEKSDTVAHADIDIAFEYYDAFLMFGFVC